MAKQERAHACLDNINIIFRLLYMPRVNYQTRLKDTVHSSLDTNILQVERKKMQFVQTLDSFHSRIDSLVRVT